jgi:GGDEF domain-containing protein
MHEMPTGADWRLLFSELREEDPLPLADRLRTLVEDVLDADGGLEERSLRVAFGLSLLGADAADAQQLVTHAALAARVALGQADPSAVEIYSLSEHAVR